MIKKKPIYEPPKEEPEGPKPIKGNLFLLPRSPVPWGMLSDKNHIKCGYCGKDIRAFSNRVFVPGDNRLLPKWYSCYGACDESTRQRVQFLDKKIVKWMKDRIVEKVGECHPTFDTHVVMKEFARLTEIALKRRELQHQLHITGYKTEDVVAELVKVEKEYETQQIQLDAFDPLPFQENPLIAIMLETPLEEIEQMDINYLRKMFDFMVHAVRIFKEYMLIRAVPITEREYKITEGFGPQSSINLRSKQRIPGTLIKEESDTTP